MASNDDYRHKIQNFYVKFSDKDQYDSALQSRQCAPDISQQLINLLIHISKINAKGNDDILEELKKINNNICELKDTILSKTDKKSQSDLNNHANQCNPNNHEYTHEQINNTVKELLAEVDSNNEHTQEESSDAGNDKNIKEEFGLTHLNVWNGVPITMMSDPEAIFEESTYGIVEN